MEFYLKLDRSKVFNEKTYSSFIKFSLGKFRRILLNKLDFEKCAIYDTQLKNQCKLIGIDKEFICKNFTYKLLLFAIKNIRHIKTNLGEHFYIVDIPLDNPFGKKLVVDKILRIIEYGQGLIRPYRLFNDGFIDYKLIITDRYNKTFKKGGS